MGDLLGDIPDRPTTALGDTPAMTSVQLRYSGPAVGFRWLVEDLQTAGLDPAFPPLDHVLSETEIILDLRRTEDEGIEPSFSDPGGLEVVHDVLHRFRLRFQSSAEEVPLVRIVGVQSSRATANAVILKDPKLAFCTDAETAGDDPLTQSRDGRSTFEPQALDLRHQRLEREERRSPPWLKSWRWTSKRGRQFWARLSED
ncbi:MAG: hypothetical protein ACI8TP_004346 [Acidimicrobiales bacterium]|jgi:hypothetical protein